MALSAFPSLKTERDSFILPLSFSNHLRSTVNLSDFASVSIFKSILIEAPDFLSVFLLILFSRNLL